MEDRKRYVCKKDGKIIIDIEEYRIDEGYCVALMDDGEVRVITDKEMIKDYQLEETKND